MFVDIHLLVKEDEVHLGEDEHNLKAGPDKNRGEISNLCKKEIKIICFNIYVHAVSISAVIADQGAFNFYVKKDAK
jgi:hypothetical protein